MAHPNDPELAFAKSMLNDDPQKAYEAYDAIFMRDPTNTRAAIGKIFALNRMEKWPEANEAAHQYVVAAPEKSTAYWMRAEAHCNMGLYSEAITDSNKAISLDTRKTLGNLPYRLNALCHAHLGIMNEAFSWADKAGKLSNREWFPPLGRLPSGTMSEMKAYLQRIASQA